MLSTSQLLKNMYALSYFVNKESIKHNSVKENFVSALNLLQGYNLHYSFEPKFEFHNSLLIDNLIKVGIISEKDASKGKSLITEGYQQEYMRVCCDALKLINELDEGLYNAICLLISTILFFPANKTGGGSLSNCISIIWISPKNSFNRVKYAEFLVHEFIHNYLFLSDMVNNIFPEPEQLESNEAVAISSILKTKRRFDKAFHSAYVSIGLMYFYHLLGDTDNIKLYHSPLLNTIEELNERDVYFKSKGHFLLSPFGRDLLLKMRDFAYKPCYREISLTLNTTQN